MTRILVIDDEPAILRAMQLALTANGFEVVVAATGTQGVGKAAATNVHLVVVDLGLPDIGGLDVIRQIRTLDARTPIIVLSAWQEIDTKVKALDLGADDYVEKPFNMPELLARVRVALRRGTGAGPDDPAAAATPDTITRGDVTVDLARRTTTVRGEPVELTRTQFDLLAYLVRHPHRVLTHRAIAMNVWGPDADVDPANLRVVVSQIRKRIEADPSAPRLVRTILGIGYAFEPEPGAHNHEPS